jgi:hypothetical protein
MKYETCRHGTTIGIEKKRVIRDSGGVCERCMDLGTT